MYTLFVHRDGSVLGIANHARSVQIPQLQLLLLQVSLKPPSSNEVPSVPISPQTVILVSTETEASGSGSGWAALHRGQLSRTGMTPSTSALEETMPR